MKVYTPPSFKVLLFTIILTFQFSCSKDSDLLSDYVITDTEALLSGKYVVADQYQLFSSGSIILDVLANDSFDEGQEVRISETSSPSNGTVVINNNQTITYTPTTNSTSTTEIVDTFTYTAEAENGDGTTTVEEASVVITAMENIAARQEAVSLESYGAVGDGVTDDTAAIQNALDNEAHIVSAPNKTYLITKTLNINKNMAQVIDFNGSTVTRNAYLHWMINVDKRSFGNSLTTISNLKVDGNDKSGSLVDIKSRVHFTNMELFNVIHDNANGIRMLVFNKAGVYGQSVFNNVNIHNLVSVNSNGSSGNNPGMVHGFLVSAQETPSQTTQIVYLNSELYELWGEDAGGITLNSPGLDTSNSPLSFWFENISVRDAQRRTVKSFIGNTTWVNCVFTAAAANNPNLVGPNDGGLAAAGLFVIASGSSAKGATNNLICGSTFQGHPDDPFDSWYTQVIVLGQHGPAGVDIRNSTFSGDHPSTSGHNGFTAYTIPADGGTLKNISFANCTFGTSKQVRVTAPVTGYFQMSTDNTYVDGKATVMAPTTQTYSESLIPYDDCPTIN